MLTFELFAGCGGLAKGLEMAGFSHAGLLEFNRQACESLRLNFNPALVHEIDVRKVDFRPFEGVDLVSGGPPCQPFSLGGLAKAYDDARDMFPQAARAIAEMRPRAFVFENVKGLLRSKFAPYFQYIVNRLTYPECVVREDESWEDHAKRLAEIVDGAPYEGLRYRVSYKLLNAADYGVPQVRERVFIVGLRDDVKGVWTWPDKVCKCKEDRKTIRDALKGVPDPQSKEAEILKDHRFIDGAKEYPGHTGSDIDKPAKTVKAGAHGVPGGENMIRFEDGSLRYMSVHEAKLIQTFPPDFAITGSWGEALRQIGNAVPVRLAEIVGRHLRELLEREPVRRAKKLSKAVLSKPFSGEELRLAL